MEEVAVAGVEAAGNRRRTSSGPQRTPPLQSASKLSCEQPRCRREKFAGPSGNVNRTLNNPI
jgi:hypothetical protein